MSIHGVDGSKPPSSTGTESPPVFQVFRFLRSAVLDSVPNLFYQGGRSMKAFLSALTIVCLTLQSARADGPQDNVPEKVRPVPPPGVKVSEADSADLEQGIGALGKEIESLREQLQGKPSLELLPDV